jgi:hypothetical protein
MALSATIGSTRCSGPSTWPDRVVRLTVADRTRIVSGNATGASWWELKIMPFFVIHPVRHLILAQRLPVDHHRPTSSSCPSSRVHAEERLLHRLRRRQHVAPV